MFSGLMLQGAWRRYTKTAMRCAQTQVRLSLSRLSVLMCTPLRYVLGSRGFGCHADHQPERRCLLESSSSVRAVCWISDEMPTLQAVSFVCFAMTPSAKSVVSHTTPPACSICGIGGDSAGVGVGRACQVPCLALRVSSTPCQ